MIQLEVISNNIIVELNGQTTDVIIELQPLLPATGSGGGATNLSYVARVNDGVVTSDTGTDAVIPLAGLVNAGLISASEKALINTALQPDDLPTIPTKTSDLTNDGEDGINPFITDDDLPTPVFVQEANGAIHRADVNDTGGGLNSTNLTVLPNRASGDYSYADSYGTANGDYSRATIIGIANGDYSRASNRGIANGLYSIAIGWGAIANSFGEKAIGLFSEKITPTSSTLYEQTDLIFSVGIGTNDLNRLTAFSIFKNGMFKFIARALSNITNAVKGSFAVDENGRPNIHDGTQWNPIAYNYETTITNATVSTSYAIDYNIEIHRLTLTGNTTFTEANLPPAGKGKTITLEINGNFGVVLPSSFLTFLSGSYNGTATLNTIVIEAFDSFRKVQISQPG